MVKYNYGHTKNGRRSIKQSRSKRSVRFAVFQNVRVSSFEDILKNGCNVLIGFAFCSLKGGLLYEYLGSFDFRHTYLQYHTDNA